MFSIFKYSIVFKLYNYIRYYKHVIILFIHTFLLNNINLAAILEISF